MNIVINFMNVSLLFPRGFWHWDLVDRDKFWEYVRNRGILVLMFLKRIKMRHMHRLSYLVGLFSQQVALLLYATHHVPENEIVGTFSNQV